MKSCRNIKEISFPSVLTDIGNHAFYYCDKLESVILPNGLKTIGNVAFQDCWLVKIVFVPNSVTSIGNYAFRDDKNVIFFDFTTWDNTALDACTFGTDIFWGIGTSGAHIRFKYKSVATHAETITNLSAYSAYFDFEEDDT